MSARWTAEEDALLLDLVAKGLTYREIAARVGRPAEGTRMRGHHLDVPYRRRRWNAVEDGILAAGVRDRTPFAELAIRLYRSAGAVQVRASVLGLTSRRTP